jgi:phage terminase large subunit-like protein
MLKTRVTLVILFAAMPLFADDVSRLSAILLDSQNQKVTISADAWKVTANEANALANRVAASNKGKKAARDLQTHIKEMRDAALKGDADGARSHAGMALPFVYQLSK